MTASIDQKNQANIHHQGEPDGNAVRAVAEQFEPASLRTYTPTLAALRTSAGSYHWTQDGRKLADFTSGVLVANLGHNPTRWWQRVLDYLGVSTGLSAPTASTFIQAAPLTAYNAVTDLDAEASRRLTENVRGFPGGARAEQVMWAASGSEAIQKALWAALAHRKGADQILATRGGFHGKKGLAGAVTGSETDPERDPRVHFISFPNDACRSLQARREPLDLAPFERELDALADQLGDRIACLITEPYLGGGGSFHPQVEYLQLLQRFCREHDALFILDEVQANFGRTGEMYAFTTYGVEPDIVVLGKGLGNGVPVSAAVGPTTVFGNLAYGEASDTWSANPLACAAVLATLDEFEDGTVLQHAKRLAEVIESGLLRLNETPVVANVRGEGTVWGVECAAVGDHDAAQVANHCVEACYRGDDQGNAIHLLGPLAGKVLRVSPPLVMDLDEARNYFDAMYNIFSHLGERLAAP